MPATLGLGIGILISVDGLKAGMESPAGGTIWNLFTISMALRTLRVSGRNEG